VAVLTCIAGTRRADCRPEASAIPLFSAMKFRFPLTLTLAILWWLLSGYADALLLALGACSVAATVSLARRMDRIDQASHPLHLSWRLLGFGWQLLREIVLANAQVVAIVLTPKPPIQPQWVRVRSRSTSPLGMAVLGNAITLTPGTITVAIHGDELLVHALTDRSAAGVIAGDLDRIVPPDLEAVR